MNTEMERLVEEQEICGWKIRPWGITALAKLSPTFEAIYRGMKERGVSLKTMGENKEGIIFSLLPHAPAIIAVSLGIRESEIDEKVSPGDVMPIVLTIIRLNIEYLKNWSAPLTATVSILEKEAERA